jgi:hypothetical protein
MKVSRLFAGVFVSMALSSCSGFIRGAVTELQLHEGPLVVANPALVVPITSKYKNNDGSIKYTLPDGATCAGAWSLSSGRSPASSIKINPANLTSGSGWVAKDGYIAPTGDGGTRVNHGNRLGRGMGTGECSNGATFRFAFVANGIIAKGALRDSHGNLFRFVRR